MAYIEKRVHSSGKVTYRARIRVMGSPDISDHFQQDVQLKNGLTKWKLK